MSFFYDRDQNVTGTIPSSFTFVPSYGTQVTFSSELAEYGTVDNYVYNMPKAVNHLQMNISMPFENRKQEEARKIAGFFENLHGTGYFLYTDPAQIYKPINLFLTSIDNTYNENGLYTLNATLSTDQISTLLNWSHPLITGSNIKATWATSTNYQKYDVVRYTGNATFPSNTGNLYDSFYYCKEAHTSQSSITPASVDTIKWSKDFFFQPTYSVPLSKETAVVKTELPYSFTKRTNFGLHANTLKSFKLDFKGISDAEARCILHFLIGRQGYKRFQYKIPKIYNQFKIFYAPQWSHTFVYKNVNDISVTLIEDPLGKVADEITSISTNGLIFYLDFSNKASYRSGNTSYDLSGSGNSATFYNSPAYSTRNRGIFTFDGSDDYLELTTRNTNLEFQPTQSFSVFGWFYNATASVGTAALISNMYGSSPYQGWDFWKESNTAVGMHFISAWSENSMKVTISLNWSNYASKWVYLGYTYNGTSPTTSAGVLSSVNFYENAVLNENSKTVVTDGFNSSSQTITYDASQRFRVAARWLPSNTYIATLGVTVGAIHIYNRVLTQQEILTNFNAGRDRFKI